MNVALRQEEVCSCANGSVTELRSYWPCKQARRSSSLILGDSRIALLVPSDLFFSSSSFIQGSGLIEDNLNHLPARRLPLDIRV
jgi:hypothetical protein